MTAKTWVVQKKTLLGEPTQYSVDILVAFAGKKDSKIAYCYNMVFYTREEVGVAKSPPFHFANSRQYAKYKMLMSNVSAGKSRSGPTSGLFGWLLRLALSCSLLTGGLVASRSMTRKWFPRAGGMLDALVRHRALLGILLLALGILGFLRATLFFFHPLADLLPQAGAMVLGLLLAKEFFLSKTAPPSTDKPFEAPLATSGVEEPASAEDATAATLQKPKLLVTVFEKLEPVAKLLGLLGIVFGMLHLLLGAWSLL